MPSSIPIPPSPEKPLPQRPFPPRSESPPLPPRKNAAGLPPSYLRHLRRLLHQWLEQQLRVDYCQDGSPTQTRLDLSDGDERLWSDERLQALEKAIWEGAVVPRVPRTGGKRESECTLLELDWASWTAKALKRKAAWKELSDKDRRNDEMAEERKKNDVGNTGTNTSKSLTAKRQSRKGSVNEVDPSGKGRLTVPGSPLPPSISTPSKASPRPPSVTSSTTSLTLGPPTSTSRGGTDKEESSEDGEEQLRDWCRLISGLKGFEKLSLPKKDDWEVVDDDFPRHSTIQRDLPGAFPQSSSYDYHRSSEDGMYRGASSSKPRFSDLGLPTPVSLMDNATTQSMLDLEMLKPVFCLHFPPVSQERKEENTSTSTLRLRRDNSLGARSIASVDSSGGNGKKWWSGGSGGKWSELTIGPSHVLGSEREPDPKVEFVEGRYALPSSTDGKGSWRQGPLRSSVKKRKSVLDSFNHSPSSTATSSIAEGSASATSDTEGDDSASSDTDERNSSTWSGTQKGRESRAPVHSSWNAVIAGSEDDVPRNEAEDGKVGLVGGTIVIIGVQQDAERKALNRVLQLLIYTIQTMVIELDLLDAFRIPREPDEPLLPPKHAQGTFSVPHSPATPRGSTDLLRKSSLRERGDHSKGFFHRIGRESRTVWEGLLGKRRSSGSHERDHPPSPSAATLDLPITPATGSFPSLPDSLTPDPVESSASAGLPPRSVIPHPTERHLQILSRLENQVHSTTPGLVLPMPPLLLRVREEYKVRQDRAKREMNDELSQGTEGLPGANQASLPSPALRGNRGTLHPLRGRALGYRLGGDVRAGLGALASGIDTFDGWMRLQRLETLYCVSLDSVTQNGEKDDEKESRICQRPKPSTFVFWGDERDRSIEGTLKGISEDCEEETMICLRSGCTATQAEHTRIWVHAGKIACLKVEGRSDKESEPGTKGLDAWVKCVECGATSEGRKLGIGASMYSWGKLLELLFYTDRLRPNNLCSHHSSPVSHLFRTSLFVLSLQVKPVSVLDTRLPKLQVGPNVAKRKNGKEFLVTTMEGLARKEVREERVEELNREIADHFQGLDKRLDLLRSQGLDDSGKEEPSAQAKRNSLDSLTSSVEAEKASLLDLLSSTSTGQINEVRHRFGEQVQSCSAKIDAWQKKYATEVDITSVPLPVPEYCNSDTVFALPGSAILVREDEPASIIAYTLSSLAYFTELTNTTKSAPTAADDGGTIGKLEISSAPDATSATWAIDVKRRDTPRDLLSLRTIAKKKSEVAVGQTHKPPMSISLSANAPSLELSLERVEGKSQGGDRLGDLVKTISKATAQDPVLGVGTGAVSSINRSSSSSEVESAPSMPRVRSPPRGMRRLISDPETSAPPSAFRPAPTRSVSNTSVTPSTPKSEHLGVSSSYGAGGSAPREGWGSVTSTFSSSFNQLLKLGSEVGESIGSIRVRGTDRSLSSLMGPLGMMSPMDNSLSSFDDRPHIQFTYTLGDRLKLGCTVYYATAFDSLRRRCAIDKSIITSLSRTDVWDAQGGKSKAAFFMTHDKRYIVKELVSKWNVSDTHVLLEIAPAYLEHLAGTHNKATALAKIVGFYTVRINDLQTGTKRQLDLLVMENLFYKQSIARTYDLKGIEGRRSSKSKTEGEVKAEPRAEGTLFDGEWLEGMQKGLVLLQPHAKRILLEAISLDTRFLSTQSIMDYSLLLGVDEERQELVVGLVDAIGSYNLFKTIESRGKMVMNRGGEVTIIPPDQYRDRFENALKHYFLACPDKWSKARRGACASRRSAVAVPSVL